MFDEIRNFQPTECRRNPHGRSHDWEMGGTCIFCGEKISAQEANEIIQETLRRVRYHGAAKPAAN